MTRPPKLVAALGFVLAGPSLVAACSGDDRPSSECVDRAAEALRTCARGPTLAGIDVSYYQGDVDWAAVKGAGQSFAFVRVSDGLRVPDSKFADNWPAVKEVGLVRGVYQYFRPAQDPIEQADLLLDRVRAAGGFVDEDLPPVLDLETDGGLAPAAVVERARAWLDHVEAKLAIKPIVYTAAFMSDVLGTSFGGYVLWVANYGATCPRMPSGWTDWQFWQTSDTGRVDGVSGNVDTNLFNGTAADLTALTLGGSRAADAGASPPLSQGDAGAARPDDCAR